MHRVVISLTALVLACKETPKRPPPPRLVLDPEIAAFETALLKRIDETRTRTCERPLLRGDAVPGPAAPDARAIVESTGELAACGARLAAADSDDLRAKTPPFAPEILALVRECGPRYEAAIVRAVSHVDACSPYQAGIRATPRLLPVIHLAHLLGIHAHERATAGDPGGALWLLVETMRFGEDLARGHTTLLDLMVSVAVTNILVERAHAILAAHALPSPVLAELSTAVETLLAHRQPFAATFRGERDVMELYDALAPLKPATWVPPGGWPPDYERPAATSNPSRDWRDEHALLFYTNERQAQEFAAACPRDATLQACATALAGAPAQTPEPDAAIARLYAELAKAKTGDDARLSIRDAVVDTLVGIARPAYSPYVQKRARGVARLAALRIHLELARRATCTPELPDDLVEPPGLGGRMQLAVAGGTITITAPAWTTDPQKADAPIPAWECQK